MKISQVVNYFFRPTLSLLSPIWAIINFIVRLFNQSKQKQFAIPVVSVGNIVAGGVGKTEIVSYLAQRLQAQGKRVLIAQRGYKSKFENIGAIATSFEEALTQKFSDEALLLLKKNKGICVVIGKNRKAQIEKALLQFAADIILLDDGFQHFSLYRDLDILVHHFGLRFPILRDLPIYFFKKDILKIVLNSVLPENFSKKEWVQAKYVLRSHLENKPIYLWCGIGNPERVVTFLKDLGFDIQNKIFYSDHKNYSIEDLKKLERLVEESSKNEKQVVTTLKDFVRIQSLTNNVLEFSRTLEKLKIIEIEVSIDSGETLILGSLKGLFK